MNVIYDESAGVFLGEVMGLAFWSKLDSLGLAAAPVFTDEDALKMVSLLNHGEPTLELQVVPVIPDCEGGASIYACASAGLPAWLDANTETANTLPI